MASQAEISIELKRLLSVLPLSRTIDLEAMTTECLRALVPFEAAHLHEAVNRFIDGTAGGTGRTAPKVPELIAMVRQVRTEHAAADQKALRVAKQTADLIADAGGTQQTPGERARMRLKMPLWRHAMATGQIQKLAKANAEGFGAMVVLASAWGIAIPPELFEISEDEAERQWAKARRDAWFDIERKPPPFLRNVPREQWPDRWQYGGSNEGNEGHR